MHLVTEVVPSGLRLAVVKELSSAEAHLQVVEVPSEGYLRAIQETVGKNGWDAIEDWYVCDTAESFTSLRGLITLVNVTAAARNIPVFTYTDRRAQATQASLPIEPKYQAEANITL